MCFVTFEKTFDRVARKVIQWAIRKKRFTRSNCESGDKPPSQSKATVRVGSELSEDFLLQVGLHQGAVLSPLFFAIVVDEISENAREGLITEILYADNLVLMNESMEILKEKFLKWKKAFESKRLKVNLKKTKVMVGDSKEDVFMSKVDPCTKCGKRTMTNSVLCARCDKW